MLALQQTLGNHGVSRILARGGPETNTKTVVSAKVFSLPFKFGELSAKLSLGTAAQSGTDWPAWMQDPKWDLEFKGALDAKFKLSTPAFTLVPFESGEVELAGHHFKGKVETKLLEAKLTDAPGKGVDQELSPASFAFKGIARNADGGVYELELKFELTAAGLARVLQSLTPKDRAALKQMNKLLEEIAERKAAVEQMATRIETAKEGVEGAREAVAAKAKEIEAVKQSGGKVSHRMSKDLAKAKRELKRQEKALQRLGKKAEKLVDDVAKLVGKLDGVAKKGTSRLFRSVAGGLLKTAGTMIKSALVRLLGVVGVIQTLVDVAAVIRNLLNGRLFQGWFGDPWGDGIGKDGEDGSGQDEGEAGADATTGEEELPTGIEPPVEGDGTGDGDPSGEGTSDEPGGTQPTGEEGGTAPRPGDGGTAPAGGGTAPVGPAPGTAPDGPGPAPAGGAGTSTEPAHPDLDLDVPGADKAEGEGGKSRTGGESAGAGTGGDRLDDGQATGPALKVSLRKIKAPDADDSIVDAFRDAAVLSGIKNRKHYKSGAKIWPTIEFVHGGKRFRVSKLPVVVTEYLGDTDGYSLSGTVTGAFRLGKTDVVIADGTELEWNFVYAK